MSVPRPPRQTAPRSMPVSQGTTRPSSASSPLYVRHDCGPKPQAACEQHEQVEVTQFGDARRFWICGYERAVETADRAVEASKRTRTAPAPSRRPNARLSNPERR